MYGGLTLRELAVKTWRESQRHDVFGGAAELAYYFVLALFPTLIFLTSVIGFLPGVSNSLLTGLSRVVPGDAMMLVRDTLADVVSHRSGGLLSLGLIGSLWAASSGVSSLINRLNTSYDLTETRSFWKRRLVAIGLTLALTLLVVSGSLLIMFGHLVSGWLTSALEASAALGLILTIIGYLTGFALLLTGIVLVYYFGPCAKASKRPVKPGALFASTGIVIGSVVFSLYLRVAPSASATYGGLGAVVTLMLWLYLLGLVLLIGGEINSEAAR